MTVFLVAFLALAAGGMAGVFIARFYFAKHGNSAELNEWNLKCVSLQNALDAAVRQAEIEKNLREESFRREVKLLEEHAESSRTEINKTHQEQIAQLKESFEREKSTILEKHTQAIRLLEEQYERTFSEMNQKHKAQLEKLSEEFKVLSDKILQEKSEKLQHSNREQLSVLLNPLKEKMSEFKTAVEESKNKGIELNSALSEQLKKMIEETTRLGGEARTLANALKGEQKTQGDWGELILEDILQRSGLKPGCHYECQETLRDAHGKVIIGESDRKMRPDVIIHYPDEKDVIIDSKVSLTAYMDYMNAEDENDRKAALVRHIRSVRSHVDELAKKNYAAYISQSGRDTVDFVIMFIPNEGPFHLAMISEPTLWNEAFKNKVLIVSPTNLMALLKIIHIAWTREEQNRNQQEILDTAATLLERLYAFYKDFDDVGNHLDKARHAFETAEKRLKQGERNHSIVNSGEKLQKLGVRTKKALSLPSK